MPCDFYQVTTPPAADPILFAAASAWCRDIDIADTTIVDQLISAATLLVESQTNRVLESRTITGKFDCFKTSKFECKQFVELRRAPLVSVETVTVNGDVLPSADYILKESSAFARILFQNSFVLDTDLAFAIEVSFVAGYAAVPADIITAIEQLVLFWYENRGDVSTDKKQLIPLVTKQIIKQNRILNTFG
jgi:uncharacterized phiE125 gp8 family phage protein